MDVLFNITVTSLLSQIEVARRKGEELPAGWGCDSEGIEATKPEAVLNGGGLLPLGGREISGL